MSVNIENLKSHGDSIVRSEHTVSELRQRGWLLQLEKAMLDQATKPGVASLSGGASSPESDPITDNSAVSASAESPTNAHSNHSGTVRDNSAHTAATEARPTSAGDPILDKLPNTVASMTANGNVLFAGTSTLPRTIEAAWRVTQTSGLTDIRNVTAPEHQLLSRMSPTQISVAPAPGNSEKDDESLLPQAEFDEHRSNTFVATDSSPSEEYARRLIHIYYGPEGIQAWIRDAQLELPQAENVALMLGSELQAYGYKVTELTVNGKRIAHESDEDGVGKLKQDIPTPVEQTRTPLRSKKH